MFKKLLLLSVLAALTLQVGCRGQRRLKSPCIKSSESISCELYSVNDHWLNKYKVNNR
ncbi:type IV secretion system protein VirB7 [Wolbachia endosymbiont of Folsomia candida]|nr:type IV secretion system protein VirB7 [Wolbachia endosymbiont of Folsomia candida]